MITNKNLYFSNKNNNFKMRLKLVSETQRKNVVTREGMGSCAHLLLMNLMRSTTRWL